MSSSALSIALLGDSFLTPQVFKDALDTQLSDVTVAIRETTLPWPHEPYGPVAEVSESSGTEDDAIAAIGDAEICLTQMAPLTERVLSATPRLRLVCVARGGPVNVNLEAARARGVDVRSAPGRNASATAEHTVALLLAAARRIPERHQELTDGQWRSDYYSLEQCGPELGRCRVGLIGFGAVGARVAAALSAMGSHILVYDPYAPADGISKDYTRVDELDDLLRQADVCSLHARLTDETRGLIGARELALLPRGAILVNAARGPLLDYDAVCDAVDAGHLYGAGFDVFPEEPMPKRHRLLRTPHVVYSPHLAGATQQTARLAADICAREVRRYLDAR